MISPIGTKLSLGGICGGPIVAAPNSSSVYVKCGKVLQISNPQNTEYVKVNTLCCSIVRGEPVFSLTAAGWFREKSG